MNIEIKSRLTGDIIITGDFASLKEACEKNKANLSRANLSGADLHGAYLYGADLSRANLSFADLSGAYLSRADLHGADLRWTNLFGANLHRANLYEADLHGAYLYGANLSEANLSLATGYLNSHNFFAEIVRRQATESFTSAEWVAIGQITLHRLCWDSIEKRFASDMHHIFEVLAQAGFSEWLNYWNKS